MITKTIKALNINNKTLFSNYLHYMKKYLQISNMGVITQQAIELFGFSDKREDSSLIGEKGTGLKFSRFQALRQGIDLYVTTDKFINWIEQEELDKYNNRIIFKYKDENGKTKSIKSSYTTMAGFGDWIEEWFIVREVIQNARDEQVRNKVECEEESLDFILSTMKIVDEVSFAKKGNTNVYIELTDEIKKIFIDIKKYIRSSKDILHSNEYGRIYKKSSDKCRIFKKGIFIGEVLHGLYDYDVNTVDLSESRTIKDTEDVFHEIAKIYNASTSELRRELLREANNNFNIKELEMLCSWRTCYTGSVWEEDFKKEFGNKTIIHNKESCSDYQKEKVAEKNLKIVCIQEVMYSSLKNGGVKTLADIEAEDPLSGIKIVKPSKKQSDILSNAIIKVNKIIPFSNKVVCFDPKTEEFRNTYGFYDQKDNLIYINKEILESNNLDRTLIEEVIHAVYKADDCTRDFQNITCSLIANLIS